jgi:hypothetical protein
MAPGQSKASRLLRDNIICKDLKKSSSAIFRYRSLLFYRMHLYSARFRLRDAILDDAAVIGISSGTLGRFLTNLDLGRIDCDVNEVISMAEKRMKTVNALIRNGCSWREDITILKDVLVDTRRSRDKRLVIGKLKEAGINVTLECCRH